MKLNLFAPCSAILAGLCLLAGSAHAKWTVTTYEAEVRPEITSMAIADQYFTGALPQRFTGMSTISQIDVFENGSNGQFTVNNPIPGLDNLPAAGDTNDYTVRISGTLRVAAENTYNFFTDSDDGNRFRLDLNQNGTFEDATESIVPDGGLQGAGNPGDPSTAERSGDIVLAAGDYKFEISMFERGGGASIDAGYRRGTSPTALVLGDGRLGITLVGPADVKSVGAAVGGQIVNFARADEVRSGVGLKATHTAFYDVYNINDFGGVGDFPNDNGAPGLGAPQENDNDDFVVAGTGKLVVPTGGITGAIFRSNTDDGGRLLIDLNRDGDLADPEDVVINQDALQGNQNTDSSAINLLEGHYLVEYSWFERGGGGGGEVSVNLGNGFRLLGDNEAVGMGMSLDVVAIPEPAALTLAGLVAIGLAGVARRRK